MTSLKGRARFKEALHNYSATHKTAALRPTLALTRHKAPQKKETSINPYPHYQPAILTQLRTQAPHLPTARLIPPNARLHTAAKRQLYR